MFDGVRIHFFPLVVGWSRGQSDFEQSKRNPKSKRDSLKGEDLEDFLMISMHICDESRRFFMLFSR